MLATHVGRSGHRQPAGRAHDPYASFSARHKILGSGYYKTVPPAWREKYQSLPTGPSTEMNRVPSVKLPSIEGSQILVTNLPRDVDQKDVEELFGGTIGKLHGIVLAHDKNGTFLGIAMVAFVSKDHALKAHQMYNGRVVDGRAPIRVDLVMDASAMLSSTRPPPLIDRLGPPLASSLAGKRSAAAVNGSLAQIPTGPRNTGPRKAANSLVDRVAPQPQAPLRHRTRFKRGPRRVRKSAVQLDLEIEDWQAAAPPPAATDQAV